MPTPPRLLSTRLLRFARNDGRRGEDGLLSTDYCLLIKGVDAMFDSVIAIVVLILKIALLATAIWAYATLRLKGLILFVVYIVWTDVIGSGIDNVFYKIAAGQMSVPWGESAGAFYARISYFHSIVGTIILGLGLLILAMEIKKLKR